MVPGGAPVSEASDVSRGQITMNAAIATTAVLAIALPASNSDETLNSFLSPERGSIRENCGLIVSNVSFGRTCRTLAVTPAKTAAAAIGATSGTIDVQRPRGQVGHAGVGHHRGIAVRASPSRHDARRCPPTSPAR